MIKYNKSTNKIKVNSKDGQREPKIEFITLCQTFL